MGTLVLITGTGRSGTSTMSGTFHHLGLFVPGPYLGANESNPKGFYESKWAVRFHKRITRAAGINEFDSRPAALGRVRAAITDADRAELRAFLAEQVAQSDQIVVKDPRTVWTQALWAEVAAEFDLEMRCVSMLRHPAEVVGSRATYYTSENADEHARRRYEIFSVTRWINNSLVNERETRPFGRAFVRYEDLLEDWRPVLTGLEHDLGLRYGAPIDGAGGAAVDEFIDPDLRRHRVRWDDLDVPPAIVELAEEVWGRLQVLADGHGVDAAASAAMDDAAVRYEQLLREAAAVSHDAIEEARRTGQEEGAAQARAAAEEAAAAAAAAAPAKRGWFGRR